MRLTSRFKSTFLFGSLVLSLSLALNSMAQSPSDFNIPEELDSLLTTGPFAASYSISARINPFYLRGDFDGDGKADYAILVVSKKDQSSGIAIWLTSQKKIIVLGAGKPFKMSGQSTSNLDFVDFWQVREKNAVEGAPEAGPPPRLIGEAILAGKSEDGDGLIYWTGKEFRWYQQGD
jgi:hypothetical protein